MVGRNVPDGIDGRREPVQPLDGGCVSGRRRCLVLSGRQGNEKLIAPIKRRLKLLLDKQGLVQSLDPAA